MADGGSGRVGDGGTGGDGGREFAFRPLRLEDPDELAGFRLVARLGSGGMGTVYLSHMPDGQPTALKVIRPELAEAPDFQRQFEREIRAARRVRGHFTVPVLESDIESPVPWLATSYVAGPSLGEAVGAYGPLPADAALRLVAGVAEALRDIHAAEVVHRDLKPSNVLLAADGPRVIDFGIARAADATASWTEGARRVGTPGFMAPEQVRADEMGTGVTGRADMFALGLLACFAATGRGAFGRGNADALLYRIVHDEPDLTGCPDALRDIVTACLVKDPAGRPGTEQVLSMCTAYAAGASVRPAPGWLPPALARETALRAAPAAPGGDDGQQPTHPDWLAAGPPAGAGAGASFGEGAGAGPGDGAAAPYRGGFGPVIIRSEPGGRGYDEGATPPTLAAGGVPGGVPGGTPPEGGPTPAPGPYPGPYPGPSAGQVPDGGPPTTPGTMPAVPPGPVTGPAGGPGAAHGGGPTPVPGFGPPTGPPGPPAPVAGGPAPTWLEQQLAATAQPSAGGPDGAPRRKRTAVTAALAVVLVVAMLAGGGYALGLLGGDGDGGGGGEGRDVTDLASGQPVPPDEADDAHSPGVVDPDGEADGEENPDADESLSPADPEEREDPDQDGPDGQGDRDDENSGDTDRGSPAPSTSSSPSPSRGTTPADPEPTPTPTRSSPSATQPSPGQPGRDHCSFPSGGEWSEGQEGAPVKQIQCLLNHNYDQRLDVDGMFGPKTAAAVRGVQSCSGIAVDGIVGPNTWRYLNTPKRSCGN